MYTSMDFLALHGIEDECEIIPSTTAFVSVQHQVDCNGGGAEYICYAGSVSLSSGFRTHTQHVSTVLVECHESASSLYPHIAGPAMRSETTPFHAAEMDSAHGLTSTTVSTEEGAMPPAVEYPPTKSRSSRGTTQKKIRSRHFYGHSGDYSISVPEPPVLGSTLPITAAFLAEEDVDEDEIVERGGELSEFSGGSWNQAAMGLPEVNSNQLEVSSSHSYLCARDCGQISEKFRSFSSSTLVPTVFGATCCHHASPTTTIPTQPTLGDYDAVDCRNNPSTNHKGNYVFEMGGDACCCCITRSARVSRMHDDYLRENERPLDEARGIQSEWRQLIGYVPSHEDRCFTPPPSYPAHSNRSDNGMHREVSSSWSARVSCFDRKPEKDNACLRSEGTSDSFVPYDCLRNYWCTSLDQRSSVSRVARPSEIENVNPSDHPDNRHCHCFNSSSPSSTTSASAASQARRTGKHSPSLPLSQLVEMLPLSEEEVEEMARRDKEKVGSARSAILSQTNLKAHQQRFRHAHVKNGLEASPPKPGPSSNLSKKKQNVTALHDVLHECKFLGMEDVLASVSNLSAAEFRNGCDALKPADPEELSINTAELLSIQAGAECSPRTSCVASPGSSCYLSPHATASGMTPGRALVLAAAMTERSLHKGTQGECSYPSSPFELFTAWQENPPLGPDCSSSGNSRSPLSAPREGRTTCYVSPEEQSSFRCHSNMESVNPSKASLSSLPLSTFPIAASSERPFDPLEHKVCTATSTATACSETQGQVHSPANSSASYSHVQFGNAPRVSSGHFPAFGISTDSKQSSVSPPVKRCPSHEIVFTLPRKGGPPLLCRHFQDELAVVHDLKKSAEKAAIIETIPLTKTEVAT